MLMAHEKCDIYTKFCNERGPWKTKLKLKGRKEEQNIPNLQQNQKV